jgi:uncharacterized protein (TIGR00369 family)
MPDPTPLMTAEEVSEFLDREYPQLLDGGRSLFLERVRPGGAAMRLAVSERHLRPGGTVSGPNLMMLADVAAYAAVLAHIGPVALAVTTNLSINFLRKPEHGDVVAEARLLKLGRRLAVVEVAIRSDGAADPVAQAAVTYSIPPRPER